MATTEATPWGASKKTGEHSDWIAIQRKTFTRWCNQYLKRNGLKIDDLNSDLSDGLKLASLLQVISGESLGKMNKMARIEIQKMENLNKCISFLKDHEIPLVNIGSRDIMSGNEKLILGMIWTIILRFEVNDADGKAGLLLWCQRSTKGYEGVDVKNFTSSWNDGLAFCAIVNRYRPDLLDFEGLKKEDALNNLEKVFAVSEEKLGIERLLDPEDVANVPKPDEKSIIAYVSQFFKLFAGAAKNEALIKSIERAVAVTREHDRLISEYTEGGEALAAWVAERTAALSERDASDTTAKIKERHADFLAYKADERPAHSAKRAELESVYNVLRSSKRNNKRPEFVPENAATTPDALHKAFDALDEAEQAHERALLDKYTRFQKVDLSASRFHNKAATVEEWLNEREAIFREGELGSSVQEVKAKLQQHSRYEHRLEQYTDLVHKLRALATSVAEDAEDEHADAPAVAKRMAEVDSLHATVTDLGASHKTKLLAALEREEALHEASIKFEALAEELDFELDGLEEQLREPLDGATVEQVRKMASLELAAMRAKITEVKATLAQAADAAALLGDKKPNASAELKAFEERCAAVETAAAERETQLNARLDQENARDALKKRFAEAAEGFAQFVAEQEEALARVGASAGDLDAQMEAAGVVEAACSPEGEAASQRLPALEQLGKECEEAHIVDNNYTRHTLHSITALWAQLCKNVSELKAALTHQLLAQQSAEVSPELLSELREVFEACDQDKDSLLNLSEFKNAVAGGGIDMEDDEVEKTLKLRSPDRMALDLDQFVAFALEQIKSGDSEDDVLAAFRSLSGGGTVIPPETINVHFPSGQGDLNAYLTEHIVDGDYTSFTHQLFAR